MERWEETREPRQHEGRNLGTLELQAGFFLIRWWFHYILQTVLLKHLLYGSTPWSDPELGLYALCGGFTFFLYASMWISFRFSDFIPPPKNIPVGPLARVSYSYMWTGNPYSVYSHHTPSGLGIKLRIPDQDKVLTDEWMNEFFYHNLDSSGAHKKCWTMLSNGSGFLRNSNERKVSYIEPLSSPKDQRQTNGLIRNLDLTFLSNSLLRSLHK